MAIFCWALGCGLRVSSLELGAMSYCTPFEAELVNGRLGVN